MLLLNILFISGVKRQCSLQVKDPTPPKQRRTSLWDQAAWTLGRRRRKGEWRIRAITKNEFPIKDQWHPQSFFNRAGWAEARASGKYFNMGCNMRFHASVSAGCFFSTALPHLQYQIGIWIIASQSSCSWYSQSKKGPLLVEQSFSFWYRKCRENSQNHKQF